MRNSTARASATRSRKPAPSERRFAVCVRNDGYEASPERNKIYAVLTDEDAEWDGDLRVVDKSRGLSLLARSLRRRRGACGSRRARADSSVVLTFDLDFGEVLALGIMDKPSVIILRPADERADSVNHRLSAVLAERLADLESGALILIEDARYRVRKLPIGRT